MTTLYLFGSAAPPVLEVSGVIKDAQARGWDVCLGLTPTAAWWLEADLPSLEELTGHPVRSEYKRPDEPDVLPPPDAIVVAPATFNTINKWAYGISDTLALGLLNEAVGLGTPVIAVPTPSTALARHPAFTESVHRLRSWGVDVLFDPDRYPLPAPYAGSGAAELFPWDALLERVRANGRF